MGHPYCIVVNSAVEIGRDVHIHQCVTIGSKRHGRGAGIPCIGDGVVIYPNAVIFGGVRIGDGAVIGAGAVVFCDVPTGAVAVGNPARVIDCASR
ncbi:hypothetical protein ABXR19_19145 [Uliginosibacterium flavum]|uniref:Serine acetyltransferase n=1 Tax=Uliginosibacterium flavum TaxID=1396831 RepID=A0ABV2TQU5_9RHOO